MKILLSWSSGKDSAWALHVLTQTHPGAVAALLTTVNETVDRVAMRAVRHQLLEAQARATGLPVRVVPIPHPCANEISEQRMGDPCGEHGDFRTCVYAGPMFAEALEIDPGETVTREPFVWADFNDEKRMIQILKSPFIDP